jgi:hypothetical protein
MADTGAPSRKRGRGRTGAGGAAGGPAGGGRGADAGAGAPTSMPVDVGALPKVILPTGVALDFSDMPLKPDHDRRPFWITPNGRIFLEGAVRAGDATARYGAGARPLPAPRPAAAARRQRRQSGPA